MKNVVIKNTLYLTIGSFVSKGLMFALLVFLARSLNPEEYGYYVTAIQLVSIVAVVSNMGFDMTIIRESAKLDSKEREELQYSIFPFRLFFAIVGLVIVLIIPNFIDYDEKIKLYILYLSPLILLGGMVTSGITAHLLTSLRITEKMQEVSMFEIIRILSLVSIFMLFIYVFRVNVSVEIFISSILLSLILAQFYLHHRVKKYYHSLFVFKFDFALFNRLKNSFFLFGLISILSVIIRRVDMQMISTLKNSYEVGLYSASWQVVNIGMVVMISFAMSLFPNSVRKMSQESYRNKLFRNLTIVSITISILFFILSPLLKDITLFIYGEAYVESAKILSILIFFLPIRLFGLWGTQVLEINNRLWIIIAILFVPFLVNIILNYMWIPQYGAYGASIASIISISITAILTNYTAYIFLKREADDEK